MKKIKQLPEIWSWLGIIGVALLGFLILNVRTVYRWYVIWPKICQSAEFLQSDGLSPNLPKWVMHRDMLDFAECGVIASGTILFIMVCAYIKVCCDAKKMFRNWRNIFFC
ncbi:MAG: hypothetical protein E7012_03425 [Alphaproteobacteria bacterium]|nr:hypothetical protein [Alphaproteobacteria bacterium]